MLNIVLLGKGGNGNGGTVASAPGGGGGSGGQTILTIPLALLPDTLYLSLAGQSATTTLASYISVSPNNTANNVIAMANGGSNSAGIAGGAGGAIATVATMPLGWAYQDSVLAGQAGSSTDNVSPPPNLNIPITGIIVTGGGAGAGAAAVNNGASIVGAGAFPTNPGGLAGTISLPGNQGFAITTPFLFFYGGSGAASENVTQSIPNVNGGNGAYGCGGGGAGFASFVQPVGGNGGSALAILTCW